LQMMRCTISAQHWFVQQGQSESPNGLSGVAA
jgi:hypothetical protein